jgi:tetratricopeptide (TPR) repeat protein
MSLEHFEAAAEDFSKALLLEPDSQQVTDDLQKCRKQLEGKFTKVQIVEEDEDSAEEADSAVEAAVESTAVETAEDSETAELMETARNLRTRGNDLYQKGSYEKAIEKYEEAMEQLMNISCTDMRKVNKDKASLLNNIATCHMQMSQPEKVIQLATAVLSYSEADNATQVKAYLKRGLAYETLEKYRQAKEDMLKVKGLNPGNLQASQALHRLSSVLKQDLEKEAIESKVELERLVQELTACKNQGNTKFKQGDMDLAILEYTAGIERVRTLPEAEIVGSAEVRSLLVLLCINRAAANLSLGCNVFVINDARLALKYDENNSKAHYRLAKALANCNQWEEAATHYNRVVELMPDDLIVKNELAEVQVKMQSDTQNQSQRHSTKRKKSVSFTSPLEELKETPKPKSRKVDRQVVDKAAKKALGSLSSFEQAKNASAFESAAYGMRANLELFYEYLTVHSPELICSFFEKTQLSSEVLSQIMKALLKVGDLNAEWTYKLLQGLPSTSKFSLTIKFLTKSEKASIGELVTRLSLSEALEAMLIRNLQV